MCGRFALGRDPEEIVNDLQRQLFANRDDGAEPEEEAAEERAATPERAQEQDGDAEAEAALAEAEGQTPPPAAATGSNSPGPKKGQSAKGKGKEKSVAGSTELRIEWGMEAHARFRKRYNISPKSYSPVLRRANMSNTPSASLGTDNGTPGTKPAYKLDGLQWGLIPSWSKEPPTGPQHTINATCEKLFEGGGLWGSVRDKKRCVVIASGLYEWKADGKGKVPHFMKMKGDKLMMLAGLWDKADYKGAFDEVSTFTIITVPVSKQLSFLHHRMPAILETPEDVALWLSDKPWSPQIKSLIKTYPGEVEVYPVDPAVGKVQNDSPDFILPLAKKKGTLSNMFAKQLAASPTKPPPDFNSKGPSSPPHNDGDSSATSSTAMKKSASASSASSSTSASAPKPSPKLKKEETPAKPKLTTVKQEESKSSVKKSRAIAEVIELSSDDEDEGDATVPPKKKVKVEDGKSKGGPAAKAQIELDESAKADGGGALDSWIKKG